jgi:AcrR family transcriptional regulator
MARTQHVDDRDVFAAARAVLTDRARLTTALVAERAGVSEALLFKRYGSKAGLMRVVSEDALASMLASIAGAERGLVDQAGLAELAADVLGHIRVFVPMALAHMGEPLEAPQLRMEDPPPMRALRALTAVFANQMERGAMRASDPVTVARAFIGAVWQYAFEEALMRMRGRKPEVSPEDLTTNLASFLWSGLAPPVRVTRHHNGDPE